MSGFYLFSKKEPNCNPSREGRRMRHSYMNMLLCFMILLYTNSYTQAQPCAPIYLGGCSGTGPTPGLGFGIDINSLHISGDASTAINDLSTGCSTTAMTSLPDGWRIDTAASITVHPGGTYTVTVNSEAPGGNIQAFVDFDDNHSFTSIESVGGTNGVTVGTAFTTFTISIPPSAATGIHYFRFNLSGNYTYPSFNGCPVPIPSPPPSPPVSNGETHDYKINVTTAATTCSVPTGLAASSITTTGATISWSAVTGSSGYEYVINTTSADPTGSGTSTLLTSTSPSTLTASTTYYAHVRNNCGSGNYSEWVTISFTTASPTGCGAITGLTASGVTNTSATVSWTPVSSSPGYQYAINTTAAAPSGSGTVTTTTSINPTGLAPATVYYAHVRDSCGATSLSAWVTTSFTTTATAPACSPVAGFASSGITSHGATIAWTAVPGTVGFKYVINATAADPTVPGIFTTLNSTPVSGLASGTTYYAHVRDSCGAGNVSVWTTISFTTLVAAGVANTAINEGGIIAYPNPVKDMLTLKASDNSGGNAVVQLTDISGKLLKVMPMNGDTLNIDMTGLPQGMYVIRYTNAATSAIIKITK